MDRREFLGTVAAAGAVAAGLSPLLISSPAHAKPPVRGEIRTFTLAPSIRPRPTTTWKTGDGKTMSLADFAGKVVLLNFYAAWCPPCIRELPSVDRLQAKLKSDKFEVIAMSIDAKGKSTARRLIKRQLKLQNLDLHLDPKSVLARSLGLRSMPTTYVFDAKGHEVGKLEGAAEWDSRDAVALMKYFIDNPKYSDSLS